MKTSLFTLFAMLTPLISLWMPATVLADDNKVHPRALCVPASSSVYANGGIETALGTIVNLTSDTILVTCPIVRDNTTNANGLRNVTVRVFIPEEAADLIATGDQIPIVPVLISGQKTTSSPTLFTALTPPS
jgi:hypothetical protein